MPPIKHVIQKGLKSRLGKDFAYTFMAQVIVMIAAVAINKIVSHMLGVEGYAEYNIARRGANMLAFFVSGGMGIAVTRYIAINMGKGRTFATAQLLPLSYIIVGLYFVILLLAALLFPQQMMGLLLGQHANITLFVTVICYALGYALNMVVISALRGYGYFRQYNIVQIIIQSMLILCAIAFGHSVVSLLMAFSVAYTLYSVYLFVRTTTWRLTRLAHSGLLRRGFFRKLSLYGMPRMLFNIVVASSQLVPLLLIEHKYGQYYAGLFSGALAIQLLITPLFDFTGTVFLQRVSILAGQKNYVQIKKMIRIAFFLFIGVATLGLLVVYTLPELWLQLLFTKEFIPATPLVRILALSLIPRAVQILHTNPLDAVATFPYNLLLILIWYAVYIVLIVTSKNIEACAWAYTIATAVMGGLSVLFWQWTLSRIRKKSSITVS